MRTALARSLRGLAVDEASGAAVELAKKYAAAIDDAFALKALTSYQMAALKDAGLEKYIGAIEAEKVLKRLGPELLETLAELGMTPKARNSVLKGGDDETATDKLADLRRRREARAAS